MTTQFANGGVVLASESSDAVAVFLTGCDIPGARTMAAPLRIAAIGRYLESRGAIVAYEAGEAIDRDVPTYFQISSPSGITGPWERFIRPEEARRIGEEALTAFREINDTSL